jgi:hypothetical protein
LPGRDRPGVDCLVRRVDGDDLREVGRRVVCDISRPGRVASLHDEDLGAGVGELVTKELAPVRGVDRNLDCTDLDRGEERNHLLGTVLEQGRDPVAAFNTHLTERLREAIRLATHLARGE